MVAGELLNFTRRPRIAAFAATLAFAAAPEVAQAMPAITGPHTPTQSHTIEAHRQPDSNTESDRALLLFPIVAAGACVHFLLQDKRNFFNI